MLGGAYKNGSFSETEWDIVTKFSVLTEKYLEHIRTKGFSFCLIGHRDINDQRPKPTIFSERRKYIIYIVQIIQYDILFFLKSFIFEFLPGVDKKDSSLNSWKIFFLNLQDLCAKIGSMNVQNPDPVTFRFFLVPRPMFSFQLVKIGRAEKTKHDWNGRRQVLQPFIMSQLVFSIRSRYLFRVHFRTCKKSFSPKRHCQKQSWWLQENEIKAFSLLNSTQGWLWQRSVQLMLLCHLPFDCLSSPC